MFSAGEPEKNGGAGNGMGNTPGAGGRNNGAHGGGSHGAHHGNSHGGSQHPGEGPLARYNGDHDELKFNDPRTSLLMEQLVSTLVQENRRMTEEKAPGRGFDYAAMLRRRWPVMLGVFLLVAGAALWKLRPGAPNYVAVATMLLPKEQKSASLSDLNLARSADVSSNVQTQIAIVTSDPMIERAWRRLEPGIQSSGWGLPARRGVADGPPYRAVTAAAPVSPDLVDITVTARTPDAAKALANIMVTVYREQMRQWADDSTIQNIEDARKQVDQARVLFLKAKQELTDFQQESGVPDLAARLNSVTTRIDQLQQESAAARQDADAGLTSSIVLADPLVGDLQKKVNDARIVYEDVQRKYQPDAPETVTARSALADATGLLEKRQGALLARTTQKAAQLETQLAAARAESARLPQVASKFNQLSTNVDLLGSTYKSMSDRYNELRLNRNTEVSTAKMVSPAASVIPTGRTWPRVILMALICGLIMSVVAGLIAEQIDNTVHSTEELESLVNATVLGSLPMFRDDAERRLAFAIGSAKTSPDGSVSTQLARPQSPQDAARLSAARPLLEACRILRSNVMFSSMDAPLRSILVTSADPGEGKSLCALNLATVMAYDGKRVILLDCDLRRPTQHRLASTAQDKVPMRPGFVDILAGSVSLEDALRSTPVENLKIVTSGTLPPNPPELLSSHAGQHLLEQLRDSCDLLVIDSPPLMFLTDSQVLSTFVDGSILVVAASQTARNHVQRAHTVLRNSGGRLLGVIFNKVKAHNDPDAYYGSYYSYYAPTNEDDSDWSLDKNASRKQRTTDADREEAEVGNRT